ncbi:PepSY-associated TM region [Malonomonas rubra DSM 5091]|uniref:PepSY-associated TM region n=1 Tax=Malonomonas rubra DSM 5091 TaxID=1122189 RepID=A0A1M6F435_MALRU|nr:PepSY domain-containing protein [Malonomonas rubra]SHI92430.1 PepSY-associated TM region [Malonomonas rubra DSM 5091]
MSDSAKSSRRKTIIFWRKIHLYGFGHYKWLALLISSFLIVCSLTGILYNHHRDFEILEKGRISTDYLPDSYQERLDRTRKAQGLENLFPDEEDSVPVMWLIQDLHTGQIFGFWGRIFYDLLGVIMVFLAISGCYLHLVKKPRSNHSRKDI